VKVHSIGLRTDLALHLRDGLVEEHPDPVGHLVLRTPDNPDFYGGNALVIPSLSSASDLERWERRFAEAFPAANHRSFCVDCRPDSPHADALELARARGYAVRRLAVLTARPSTLRKLALPPGLTLRPFEDTDWASQLELSRAIDAASGLVGEAHERYLAGYLASRRRWSKMGTGSWWGLWDGPTLCSSAGLFWQDGVGRYQDVMTAPAARRRGLASALISQVGLRALRADCHTLVIVSVDESDAYRLYLSLGFEVREHFHDLLRTPDPAG
jgi:GNAT superfamily N-acetyltransferase